MTPPLPVRSVERSFEGNPSKAPSMAGPSGAGSSREKATPSRTRSRWKTRRRRRPDSPWLHRPRRSERPLTVDRPRVDHRSATGLRHVGVLTSHPLLSPSLPSPPPSSSARHHSAPQTPEPFTRLHSNLSLENGRPHCLPASLAVLRAEGTRPAGPPSRHQLDHLIPVLPHQITLSKERPVDPIGAPYESCSTTDRKDQPPEVGRRTRTGPD